MIVAIRQYGTSRYNNAMSTIIAIDTSSDVASVALMDGETVRSARSEGFSTHSMTVLPLLQDLLAQAGKTLADCDAIAFGCGPGSFTGVRTACGIAQGLSFATALPVIPVVTLEAMAETCRVRTGATDVLAMLDARMQEVYWAQYRYTGDRWETVVVPSLASARAIVVQGEPACCGNALTAYAGDLAGIVAHLPQHPAVYPDAEAIARLGQAAFLRGDVKTAADIEPLYLRNKVALKTAERQAARENAV